jgi:hypothetical protein
VSKFKDDQLRKLAEVSEKPPLRLDDKIISRLCRELLDTRERVRLVMGMNDDITIEARDALEEALK